MRVRDSCLPDDALSGLCRPSECDVIQVLIGDILIDKSMSQDFVGISFYYCYYWENMEKKLPPTDCSMHCCKLSPASVPEFLCWQQVWPVLWGSHPYPRWTQRRGRLRPAAMEKVDGTWIWLEWPGVNSTNGSVGSVIGLDSLWGSASGAPTSPQLTKCCVMNIFLPPGAVDKTKALESPGQLSPYRHALFFLFARTPTLNEVACHLHGSNYDWFRPIKPSLFFFARYMIS